MLILVVHHLEFHYYMLCS